MKKITLFAGLCLCMNSFGQTYKLKDTSFTFTESKHSTSVFQNDNSFDTYIAEIQKDKLVIHYSNDESSGSTGYVFQVKSIDKKKLQENGYMNRGVGLVIKGKALKYSNYSKPDNYTEEEFILAFNDDPQKKAFIALLLKVK
jgi:hypothetical protein